MRARVRRALALAVLALIVALVAPGCTNVYVPLTALNIQATTDGDAFTPEQIRLIQMAANAWAAEIPEAWIPVGETTYARGGSIAPARGASCDGPRIGYTSIRPTVAPRIRLCVEDIGDDPLVFYLVALHEIGHALALRGDHIGSGNVMYSHVETRGDHVGHLTRQDVEYVREGMGL